MSFLQDDREFVEAIKEAKDWGTTHYLRNLFVLMLLTSTMSKPEEVWQQTWHWLADDIQYNLRKSTGNASQYNNILISNVMNNYHDLTKYLLPIRDSS